MWIKDIAQNLVSTYNLTGYIYMRKTFVVNTIMVHLCSTVLEICKFSLLVFSYSIFLFCKVEINIVANPKNFCNYSVRWQMQSIAKVHEYRKQLISKLIN
jgi:hypothetical protein